MPSESVLSELLAKFSATYGREPSVVSYAPGRIEVGPYQMLILQRR